MEDADPQSPQDFYDTSYSSYPVEPASQSFPSEKLNQSQDYDGFDEPKKAHSKTRFTEYQRGILMSSFHKASTCLKMTRRKCTKTWRSLLTYLLRLSGFGSRMPEVQEREGTPCIPKPK